MHLNETPPRLELRGITKHYPAVVANQAIDLVVQPGEIHAVLGENGAGKSTLMKIVYGVVKPDAGQIIWNGQTVHIRSPAQARALGIGMVFQHFSLFDTLTVAQNIALALEPGQAIQELSARILEVSTRYGLPLEPDRLVHLLSVGERQRVEIVRCLLQAPQLLIMDEPTSVLTPQAVRKLFETLRRLAAEGCSILYISHKLDEIRELCHTATVLRGGKSPVPPILSLKPRKALLS
ncbi:ATP-binding cassette domain-containing protein [Thiothrix eikelboomii]|uniref:ATP-binding cassette domain-containing protein n=1 Tax=Thiothrix eikelboomii TaxID=92487 RepID=UPI003BB0CB09